jgi:2',3'-cyclic-nucleotide 2'-phosphodiesterase (5'-nucleotidase family)
VGLVGVTAQFTDFYELLGWNVSDPLEAAARWVGWLRPQVDLVIVLSHLGLRLDERMAAEVPGIDLILGGHTHHVLEQPLRIGGTYVCAAGKFGKYVGEVEVTFDMTAGRIVDVNGRCVDVSKLDGDPEMSGMIARFRESGRAALQVTVAHLEEPLPLDWQRESDLGNLLAAGLKHWADAEIGLVNAGQVLEGLAPGKVTKGRLLEICPGPINPCRLRLRGEHLRQALEECLLPEFTEKPIRGFGFRGSVLGTLCVDGLRIEYDDSREPYRKLTDVRLDSGEPLDPEKEYVVGTIDMFTFGAGYLSLSKGTRVEYLLPEFLRDVLAVELQSADNIRQCRVRRWRAK